MTYSLAMPAARRGARFLDKRIPDWYLDIDLDTLDVADPQSCVLGQLNTDVVPNPYFGMLTRLFPETVGSPLESDRNAVEYGFLHSNFLSYRELDEHWRNEILERRGPNRE